MLMGDFNFAPHELPVMQWLLNQGFQSTAMLHMSKYGTDMPATCRDVTCNDQILLHPRLIACLDSIQVDKTKMFHDHDPVLICIKLHLPGEQSNVPRIHLPATWSHQQPDKALVQRHFEELWRLMNLRISKGK